MPSLRRNRVRSVTRFRNSRSWLTISIGTANSTVSQRSSVLMLARSRWLVGSSRTRISGSSSRAAAATSSSRCQPPDSVPKARSRISASTPISSISTSMRHYSSSSPTLASEAYKTSRTGRSANPCGTSCGTLPMPEPARAHDLSAVQLESAGQAFQQRRFARAVLADQRRPRAVEEKRHAAENRARAVIETGLLHAEHGLTRCHVFKSISGADQ